jgi:hypothetical protein
MTTLTVTVYDRETGAVIDQKTGLDPAAADRFIQDLYRANRAHLSMSARVDLDLDDTCLTW